MKFISRHSNHKISVRPGTQSAILSPAGVTTFQDNHDDIMVQFEFKTLTQAEIDSCKEQIFANVGDSHAFGSPPSGESGLINVDEAIAAGYGELNYEAHDVYQTLATYDTEDPRQCPPEHKEMIEDYLLNCEEFDRAYVRVDNWKLTPPWPTYPTGTLSAESAKNVVKFAQAGGFLVPALTYERNGERRSELMEAYETALAGEQVVAKQDAGLSATV